MIEATGPNNLTFAVADLHGRLDLLEAALAAIEARAPGGATIVFLGDYVDRGPQGAQVLARLVAGAPLGWRWICLKGNHEAMMALALNNPERLDWWIDNGGDTTIASYRGDRDAVAGHLAWIDSLATLHFDAHRVFVHGGVDPKRPLERQAEQILLWKRYPPDVDEGHGTRHLVHGHDPNPGGPLRLTRRTDLDTYAWATGRLAVGVFDDSVPGGPVEIIEVRARAA